MSSHINKKRKRTAYDAAIDFGIIASPKSNEAEFTFDTSDNKTSHDNTDDAMDTSDSSKVKVGLCQMLVVDDKAKNLETAYAAIEATVKRGAKIVVLPEMFNCPYDVTLFAGYSEPVPKCSGVTAPKLIDSVHTTTKWVCDVAKKFNIYLVAGSMPEIDQGKIYNTCIIAGPLGFLIAKHRKMHLFDVNIVGKMVFQESKTLAAGNKVRSG